MLQYEISLRLSYLLHTVRLRRIKITISIYPSIFHPFPSPTSSNTTLAVLLVRKVWILIYSLFDVTVSSGPTSSILSVYTTPGTGKEEVLVTGTVRTLSFTSSFSTTLSGCSGNVYFDVDLSLPTSTTVVSDRTTVEPHLSFVPSHVP